MCLKLKSNILLLQRIPRQKSISAKNKFQDHMHQQTCLKLWDFRWIIWIIIFWLNSNLVFTKKKLPVVFQKQSLEVFYKKAVLKNSAILKGKHLSWSLLLVSCTPSREACSAFCCSIGVLLDSDLFWSRGVLFESLTALATRGLACFINLIGLSINSCSSLQCPSSKVIFIF